MVVAGKQCEYVGQRDKPHEKGKWVGSTRPSMGAARWCKVSGSGVTRFGWDDSTTCDALHDSAGFYDAIHINFICFLGFAIIKLCTL